MFSFYSIGIYMNRNRITFLTRLIYIWDFDLYFCKKKIHQKLPVVFLMPSYIQVLILIFSFSFYLDKGDEN